MKQFRQGDVLIREVSSIPADVKPVEREGGRIVLAHGEVTGHSHAIASKMADFVVNGAVLRRFLDVKKQVCLRHEEHNEIKLPAGKYEVIIQREWSPEAIRSVAD